MEDAPDDLDLTEQRGIERMAEAGAAIVDGVERCAAGWTERAVTGRARSVGAAVARRRDALDR